MKDEWRDHLVVQEAKLTHYLLLPDHPQGGSKARFFLGVGFSCDNPSIMMKALLDHGKNAPLQRHEKAGYGLKYTLIGKILAPNGRNYTVKSIWMKEKSGSSARFITAYPYARGAKHGA